MGNNFFVLYRDKTQEIACRFIVGMRRLERPTPTSRT